LINKEKKMGQNNSQSKKPTDWFATFVFGGYSIFILAVLGLLGYLAIVDL